MAGTLALVALAFSAAAQAANPADPFDGNWHFAVEPYIWLPNANGSADVTVYGPRDRFGQPLGTFGVSSEIGPNDYLSRLNMAFMGLAEARKGDLSLFTDIVYVDFGNQDTKDHPFSGPLDLLHRDLAATADTSLSATVWTLGVGYTVAHDKGWNLDVFAGARYLAVSSDLTLRLAGSGGRFDRTWDVSMDQQPWDGIVGARGRVNFGDSRWFMPYYLDVGAGSSNWTWQGIVGVGYRFDWGDVTLALRSLSYSFDQNNTDLRMTGPAIGVGFHW